MLLDLFHLPGIQHSEDGVASTDVEAFLGKMLIHIARKMISIDQPAAAAHSTMNISVAFELVPDMISSLCTGTDLHSKGHAKPCHHGYRNLIEIRQTIDLWPCQTGDFLAKYKPLKTLSYQIYQRLLDLSRSCGPVVSL